ncbi:MAG: class I SAM-dependent methyltransferase [Nanoarchaeota archaeon]
MTIYTLKTDPLSSHSRILMFTKRERPSIILDVGCADGFLAKLMVQQGHTVHGIEGNAEDAARANTICKSVTIGNLDDVPSMDFPFEKGEIDIIIFGSILEHTHDPLKTVKDLLPYLKKGGKVIAAISNITHLYVRLNLLIGRFPYAQKGLLDRTHVHFFTPSSARRLLRDAGLSIQQRAVCPTPLPLVFPSTAKGRPLHVIHLMSYALTKMWPSLLGYVFVYQAKK